MKKTLSIFLSIVLAMTSCVFAISANADDSKYTFDKNTKTITITGVSTVSASLFDDFEQVYGNAVNNDSSDESASTSPSGDVYSVVENICLTENVEKVEKDAFVDFSNLKKLIVYNRDCELNTQNMFGTKDNVTIYGFAGSTAESYANNRNLDFKKVNRIAFVKGNETTFVNACEDETEEQILAKAPALDPAYHDDSNQYGTNMHYVPSWKANANKSMYTQKFDRKICAISIDEKAVIVTIKEPTCTSNGLEGKVCDVCGAQYDTQEISKKPHNFDNNAEYCNNGCGTKNPDYKAPTTNPSQPDASSTTPATSTTTSTTQAASPATSTTKAAAAPTANAKKVDGVWVDSKLKKASISKLKKGKKSITATWKKVSTIKGYQIQVATDKKFKKNKKTVTVSKQKTTKTTIKKLKANKKYYVRIRTYKNAKYNGKTVKVYSSWSKVKTIKTK